MDALWRNIAALCQEAVPICGLAAPPGNSFEFSGTRRPAPQLQSAVRIKGLANRHEPIWAGLASPRDGLPLAGPTHLSRRARRSRFHTVEAHGPSSRGEPNVHIGGSPESSRRWSDVPTAAARDPIRLAAPLTWMKSCLEPVTAPANPHAAFMRSVQALTLHTPCRLVRSKSTQTLPRRPRRL
jgi:hypothetical protein